MSAAVGSIPSFTRSGRPSPNLRSSPPSGSASTTFRSRNDALLDRFSVMVAMLESRARRTGSAPAARHPRPTPPSGWQRDPAGLSPRYAGIRSDTATTAALSPAAASPPTTRAELAEQRQRARRVRRRKAEAEGQEAAP